MTLVLKLKRNLILFLLLGTNSSLSLAPSESQRTVSSPRPAKGDRELIVGGTVADAEAYSFFALTSSDSYDNTVDNVCGAALIHPDILVSAAHCHGFFNYGVRLYNEETGRFDRRSRIIEPRRHPNFNLNNGNFNWDILIMRLEEPIYDIAPIRLNSDSNVPATDEILKAVGFGAPQYQAELSSILLEGEFQYMMPNTCRDRLENFNVNGIQFGEELLCVQPVDTPTSICQGDSGGPLITNDGVLVGITSWTVQCQAGQIPDGFTRISTMYDWIQETICEISQDRTSSCPALTDFFSSRTIEMRLHFQHDFSPEDTTFAVRNRQTGTIEYAGPTYVVSERVATREWISDFYLPEGSYAFEVYDKKKNGLSDTEMNARLGYWELYARNKGGSSDFTLVASGHHVFFEQSTTNFEIEWAPTSSPTLRPSPSPTEEPKISPTESPIQSSTDAPSPKAILSPTTLPAIPVPTERPTPGPADLPTVTPIASFPTTTSPTSDPVMYPTTVIGPLTPLETGSVSVDAIDSAQGSSSRAWKVAVPLCLVLFFFVGVAIYRSRCCVQKQCRWTVCAEASHRTLHRSTSTPPDPIRRTDNNRGDEAINGDNVDACQEMPRLDVESGIADRDDARMSRVLSKARTCCASALDHFASTGKTESLSDQSTDEASVRADDARPANVPSSVDQEL